MEFCSKKVVVVASRIVLSAVCLRNVPTLNVNDDNSLYADTSVLLMI